MAIHLFSTPIECTHCGTVVDDPTADRCSHCGELLRERRTPSRLAGVQRRYGNVRFLLGFLRFMAITTALVGVLVFVFSDEAVPWLLRGLSMLAALLLASGLFVVAALLDVMLDVEENTRATFRLQQLLLESLQEERPGVHAPSPSAPAAREVQ